MDVLHYPSIPRELGAGSICRDGESDSGDPNMLRGTVAYTPNASSSMQATTLSSEFVNAYDVVNSSSARNRVSAYLGNHPYFIFTAQMASRGKVLKLKGIFSPNIDLSTFVDFPDGGLVVYEFNYDTWIWEYVEGSAIDSHGNSIPESEADYVNSESGYGEFHFSHPQGNANDINSFIHRAHMAGIPVTGSRGRRLICGRADGHVQCVRE